MRLESRSHMRAALADTVDSGYAAAESGSTMAEQNSNLWAPWRLEYIQSLAPGEADDGCFICRYWEEPENDRQNHVVWRGNRVFVIMNRFPYTNGHLLIAPSRHVGEMQAIGEDDLMEMTRVTRDSVRLLEETLHPQGFNIGTNLGRCAGAGVPGHLHTHVVPRWSGDTNYMAVIGDVRVVPQSLDGLHDQLTANAVKLGLTV